VSSQAAGAPTQSNGLLTLSVLAALGVVFGDIGTSPLYTLKTVLDYTGSHPDPAAVFGALSLSGAILAGSDSLLAQAALLQ
jgi:KUP system potassium uptake protein